MLGWFGFGHFFVVRVLLGITGAFSWALVDFGQFRQDLSFGNGGPTVSSGGCGVFLLARINCHFTNKDTLLTLYCLFTEYISMYFLHSYQLGR